MPSSLILFVIYYFYSEFSNVSDYDFQDYTFHFLHSNYRTHTHNATILRSLDGHMARYQLSTYLNH